MQARAGNLTVSTLPCRAMVDDDDDVVYLWCFRFYFFCFTVPRGISIILGGWVVCKLGCFLVFLRSKRRFRVRDTPVLIIGEGPHAAQLLEGWRRRYGGVDREGNCGRSRVGSRFSVRRAPLSGKQRSPSAIFFFYSFVECFALDDVPRS